MSFVWETMLLIIRSCVLVVKIKTHHVNIFFLGTVHCRQDCLQFSYFILKPQVFLSYEFHVWTRPGPQWEGRRGVGKSAASNWLRCWGHLSEIINTESEFSVRHRVTAGHYQQNITKSEHSWDLVWVPHCSAQYIIYFYLGNCPSIRL